MNRKSLDERLQNVASSVNAWSTAGSEGLCNYPNEPEQSLPFRTATGKLEGKTTCFTSFILADTLLAPNHYEVKQLVLLLGAKVKASEGKIVAFTSVNRLRL